MPYRRYKIHTKGAMGTNIEACYIDTIVYFVV